MKELVRPIIPIVTPPFVQVQLPPAKDPAPDPRRTSGRAERSPVLSSAEVW